MSLPYDDWLTAFLEWTKESEAPTSYRTWVGISCIAAALQRKTYLKWGPLTFYPNMYIVLVGPSGCRKGTAMNPGYRLLKNAGIRMAAQSTTREALIRRLKEANYTHIDPETGEIEFHSSLTIFSEEFTVFLGYKNEALMADLCDWYDCKDRWVYDTKNMGTDEVQGVWVNLIGATTPSLIQTSLPQNSVGGGLTSRMIFVYEEKKEKISIFPQEDPELGEALKRGLERINMIRGEFKVTKKFFERWTEWYTETHYNPPPFKDDERFAGYCERRPTHIMKLSIILAASRMANESRVITERDLERAIMLLETTERKMPYTFSGFGQSNIASTLQRVMTYIAMKREVTMSDLMRRFYHDADRLTMERIIQTLETMRVVDRELDGNEMRLTFIDPDQRKQPEEAK